MNRKHFRTLAAALFVVGGSALAPSRGAGYQVTPLVSNDVTIAAPLHDANLINPWGLAYSATGPFWFSDNGTGLSTLYSSSPSPSIPALVVTIPPAVVPGVGNPTGIVFNLQSNDFAGGLFIFASEDGTISSWSGGTSAIQKVNNHANLAVYKGLGYENTGSTSNHLYAANFHTGAVDVFNASFAAVSLPGSFTDPTLPAGYAPFNIQNIGGKLYVAYAKQGVSGSTLTGDHQPGAGLGMVDVFNPNGTFSKRLITGGVLNAPWGLALAPSSFGSFANDLLVGNFGDGRINAFDPATGAFLGTLSDATSTPISIDGLWGLEFGNGGSGGNTNTLYFTAGPNAETKGLFGSLTVVPEPATLGLLGLGVLGLAARRRR